MGWGEAMESNTRRPGATTWSAARSVPPKHAILWAVDAQRGRPHVLVGSPTMMGIDSAAAEEFSRELDSRATGSPLPVSVWPGLTVCRFEEPQRYLWEPRRHSTFCVVAQGRHAVWMDGDVRMCSPLSAVTLAASALPEMEVVEASATRPFLGLFLEVDTSVVRRVSTDVLVKGAVPLHGAGRRSSPGTGASPSFDIDMPLLGCVLRFLRALDGGLDQQVLAPIHLQEIVYRLLRIGTCSELLDSTRQGCDAHPIRVAVQYIRDNLTERITVADIAREVQLSQSAFAHAFRTSVGVSPYQFLKSERLETARRMLVADDGATVSGVARAVGYSSTPHFISEFKRRFDITPRGRSGCKTLNTATKFIDDGGAVPA